MRRLFAAESPDYFLLLGVTLFLVLFGLVMVLSSSTISSHAEDGDFFSSASRQGLYALVGIPLMLIASRFPPSFWRRWAWTALLVAMGLQMLVFTGLGVEAGGNRNWIALGGFTAQPSELVKLALVVWLGSILATKQSLLHDWKHVFLPVGPVAGLAIGLVLMGGDLGTASILLTIVLGALFFAGIRLRIIGAAIAVIAAVAYLFTSNSASRTMRIDAWLSGCTAQESYLDFCYQTVHGWWALASGGVFGVGLGQSKSKWLWLPAAENDFIFAIIGEELGLVGAVVVLALFVVLAVAFVRILRSTDDVFERVTTSGIMIWVIGQAFVNIAVVLGVLPVLGVPLPLVSAGGSALLANLLAIGVVLSFARARRSDDDNGRVNPEPVPVARPVRAPRAAR